MADAMRRLSIALCAVLAAAPAAGQRESVTGAMLEIRSPVPDAYVTGRTPIRIDAAPAGAIRNIVFYVDGAEVCSATAAPFDCDWDAGATVAEHQIRVVANLNAGGRLVRTVRTLGVEVTDRADVTVVQVTATVTDRSGHYVRNLPSTVFRLSEDGKPQKLTNFAAEDVPLELVVAVDISDSMRAAMPTVKAAAKQFLGSIQRRDAVTVLAFNDNVFELVRASTDPKRAEAIADLEAWGATALYDVITRGVEILARKSGRKALVVFTDGEDQGSHVTIDEVERRLAPSDVTLYMIGLGRGTSFDALKKTMLRLVEPTGGRAFFTDKADELQKSFDELLAELSNQYLLAYAPPSGRPNQVRHIKVDVDGRYQVRARQSYVYSPAGTR
jgi:VWFA-related protein